MWTLIFSYLINEFIANRYNKHINKHVFSIELFIEIYSLYKKDLIFFILFTILFFQSITDYLNHDVYSLFNYILALIMCYLLSPPFEQCCISLIIPFSLILLNKLMNGMGSGDIELIIVLAFVFNFISLLLIVFLSSFMNLIYSFFIKKDKYSFVPFLSISCLIIYLFM